MLISVPHFQEVGFLKFEGVQMWGETGKCRCHDHEEYTYEIEIGE
jgi:hypothetical protein